MAAKLGIVLALVVLGLVHGLRLGSHSLVDYDEACYAQVASEMHTGGDLLLPRKGGTPFLEKPPMLYWTQVAGYSVFGRTAWGARAGNWLAGMALLLVLFMLTRFTLGTRVALRGVWVLGSASAFLVLTRIAVTDLLFTLWMTTSLLCAHRALEQASGPERGGRGWFLAAAAAAGFAMLAKGLAGVLLPGGAVLIHAVITRRARIVLRPSWLVPGLVVALGIGSSWMILVSVTHGGDLFRQLFVEHHVGRFLSPMQGHAGPLWYYLPVLLLGFLPWTPFLVPALTRGAQPTDGSSRRLLQLLLAYALLTLVFFSVAGTKLVNYATPLFPCLAIFVASGVERAADAPARGLWRWMALLSIGGTLTLAALAFALPAILERVPGWTGERLLREAPGLTHAIVLPAHVPYVLGGLLLVLAAASLVVSSRRPLDSLFRLTAASSLMVATLVVFLVLPEVNAHLLRPLERVAQRAATMRGSHAPVAIIGIRHRPSVLFHSGRPIRYVSTDLPALDALFRGPKAHDGITTEHLLRHLEARGRIEEVHRDHGYVLVRCLPP